MAKVKISKVKISIEFDEDHNEDAPWQACRESRDPPGLWNRLTKRLWKWLEPTLRVLLQIVLWQIMVAVLPLLVSAG